MTLNDILVNALQQLDRGHDTMTLDIWRDKLTRFVNDGLFDLAAALKPSITDRVLVEDGHFDLDDLSHRYMKVLRVEDEEGRIYGFRYGRGLGRIELRSKTPLNGVYVYVTYRPVINDLRSPTDVPELPEVMHPLLVSYTVGRERMSGEVGLQRGSSPHLALYEQGKNTIVRQLCPEERFHIENKW